MRRRRSAIRAKLCMLTGVLSACSSPLPRYPTMSAEDSLRVIAERLDSVRTFSGECKFVCTDEKGDTIHLDGAVAAEAPSRVRARAWKFGLVVFDVTIVEGRVWLFMPEERAALPTTQLADLAELVGPLGPQYFRSARLLAAETSAQTLVVAAPGPQSSSIACEIDRATLTPRVFFMEGRPRSDGSLALGDYAMINGMAWPLRITTLHSGGEVLVEFLSADINGILPAGAVTPPHRAVLQP